MLKQLWCLVTRGPVLNPWTEHSAVSCNAVRDSNSDDGDLDRTVYYNEPSSWSILLKTEDSPAWCHSSPSVKAQPPQVTWKFCKNILFFLQKKKINWNLSSAVSSPALTSPSVDTGAHVAISFSGIFWKPACVLISWAITGRRAAWILLYIWFTHFTALKPPVLYNTQASSYDNTVINGLLCVSHPDRSHYYLSALINLCLLSAAVSQAGLCNSVTGLKTCHVETSSGCTEKLLEI